MSATALLPPPIVTERGGLPGAPRRIAYLGASVTVQQDGYRPRLHERIEAQSGREIEQVHAGLGAVDVVGAVFLADEMAVERRPDLCVVELASPGLTSGRPAAYAEAAMDGIVAKLRSSGCGVALLHLPRRSSSAAPDPLLESFERVAGRHGVPSIDLATPVRAALEAGDLDAEEVFRDEVHTTGLGGALYAERIGEALAGLLGTADGSDPSDPGALPDPPATNLRGARTIVPDAADADGEVREGAYRLVRPYLELFPGSSITRRFEGSVEGLLLVLGPATGGVEVTDTAGAQRLMTWDPWCHYSRVGAVVLPRGTEAGAEVTVSPTGERPDYSACRGPIEPPEATSLKVIGFLERP